MAYRSLVPTVAASLLGASVVLAQPITLPSSRPAPRRAPLPASANVPGKRPVDRVLSAVGGNFAGAAGDFDERAGFADTRGVHHSRVVQKVKGVPVYGGEAIVHMRSDGSVDGVTDRLLRNVEAHLPSSLTPALTTAAAVTAAERAGGCSACLAPQRPAELFVLPTGESAKLAYRVELDKSASGTPSRPVVFVDAMTGATLRQYDNLQTGAGTTNYYGTVTLATTTSGDKRYLEDATTWRVGTFDAKNGTTSVVRAADPDDNFNDPSQKSLVDLHYGLTSTLAYLKTKHGWSGLDGSGGPGSTPSVAQPDVLLITGVAHYSVRYNNAFWNGTFIQCGDGDGTTFGPLTSLDIVAHEIGHAVIQFSSGLEYQGEPGALNESFADVLGALTERHAFGESADTWKMGEKAYTPANGTGDALRSLADPHVVGNSGFTTDDDPDHYSERYLGSSDNGGVHINSGIGNKAFYLLAKGGAHHKGGSMTGIGADDAGKIWMLAFTQYMTPTTTFAGARDATIAAATSLFGANSTQALAVATAWSLVGVGALPSPNGITNGGFELTAGPWMMSGSAFFSGNGTYPATGAGYAYLGAALGSLVSSGEIAQVFTVPPSGHGLKFALNVTSSDPASKDKLTVEVRSATGTLLTTLATFSVADKAAAGTYATRGPYSLAAYAGQSVRLTFKATGDAAKAMTFRLDDVRLE